MALRVCHFCKHDPGNHIQNLEHFCNHDPGNYIQNLVKCYQVVNVDYGVGYVVLICWCWCVGGWGYVGFNFKLMICSNHSLRSWMKIYEVLCWGERRLNYDFWNCDFEAFVNIDSYNVCWSMANNGSVWSLSCNISFDSIFNCLIEMV